jgi:hypothetical protein
MCCLHFAHTNDQQYCLRIHGSVLWNSIPEMTKCSDSIDVFKVLNLD